MGQLDHGTRASTTVALLLLAGCPDAAEEQRGPPPLPHVEDLGGPRMTRPQLVQIFYSDDPDIARLTEFSRWIVASTWLTAVGSEYGIGAGSLLGTVVLPARAPAMIDDDTIADLLFAGVADRTLPLPASGNPSDALYIINFPAGTMTRTRAETGCVEFGGYHESERRNGVELVYAVVPTCHDFFHGATDLEVRELVISHELIESVTDPIPANHPAFQVVDPTTSWLALGREVGDLCGRGDVTAAWHEAGFVAQRSWSNLAAAVGDPCVPSETERPYFNVAAAGDTLLRIGPGGRATIDLAGWATGPMPDWEVAAVAAKPGQAALTLGAARLGPDRRTTLTIDVPATTAASTALRFYVFSSLAQGDYQLLPMLAVIDEPCAAFTGCADCTSHPGCGFCTTTGRCEAQAAVGSADSTCAASSFAIWPGSCAGVCAAHAASCADCTAQLGCGWCDSHGGQCVEASPDHSHPLAGACDYEEWSFAEEYCSTGG